MIVDTLIMFSIVAHTSLSGWGFIDLRTPAVKVFSGDIFSIRKKSKNRGEKTESRWRTNSFHNKMKAAVMDNGFLEQRYQWILLSSACFYDFYQAYPPLPFRSPSLEESLLIDPGRKFYAVSSYDTEYQQ